MSDGATIGENEEWTVIINGESVEINKGDTKDEVIEKLRTVCEYSNIELSETGGKLQFKTMEAGADKSITIHCENSTLASKLGMGTNATELNAVGTDAEVTITETDFSATATVIAEGNVVRITDRDGFEMKILIDETVTSNTAVAVSVLNAGSMLLQIGANEGQTVEVNISEVSSETLGLTYLNVLTQDGAGDAITILDKAINMVSGVRSKLGAYQNRLEHAVANLDTAAQNLTEALSRIEDVDMAEEMANYTQKNVLSQAGVSMVSQANERPQNILSLLQ